MSAPDERKRLRGQMLELLALAAAIERHLPPVMNAVENQQDDVLQGQFRRLQAAAADVHKAMRERVL